MDWVGLRQKAVQLTGKYRYVLLIFLIGLGLMLIPVSSEKKQQEQPSDKVVQTEPSLSESLEQLLSQVKGAGKVRVLLTIDAGEQTLYQTDKSQSGTESTREDTVIITDENRAQSGLVQQINPPAYRGAIVLCQGADSPTVRLAIIEAVSAVTALDSSQISILKMK